MPDRAVVGDKNNWSGCYMCPHCDEIQIKTCQQCGELIDFAKPRALVAISEDRQWLVVLEEIGWWRLRRRDDDEHFVTHETGIPGGWIYDTGQRAEDVLAVVEGRRS